jgi:hypothetical protein
VLTGHRKVIHARSTDECKTLEFAGFAGLMQLGRVVVLSRAFELARGTAYESHARAYVKRIDEVQKGFLQDNPRQGFACKLDDLRRALRFCNK